MVSSGTGYGRIHEDSDGILWVGTYDGGLYRLANEQLTRYTRKRWVFMTMASFRFWRMPTAYLWMGSNRGISRSQSP